MTGCINRAEVGLNLLRGSVPTYVVYKWTTGSQMLVVMAILVALEFERDRYRDACWGLRLRSRALGGQQPVGIAASKPYSRCSPARMSENAFLNRLHFT